MNDHLIRGQCMTQRKCSEMLRNTIMILCLLAEARVASRHDDCIIPGRTQATSRRHNLQWTKSIPKYGCSVSAFEQERFRTCFALS